MSAESRCEGKGYVASWFGLPVVEVFDGDVHAWLYVAHGAVGAELPAHGGQVGQVRMEERVQEALSVTDFLLILKLGVGLLELVGDVAPIVQQAAAAVEDFVGQLLRRSGGEARVVVAGAFGKAGGEAVEHGPRASCKGRWGSACWPCRPRADRRSGRR